MDPRLPRADARRSSRARRSSASSSEIEAQLAIKSEAEIALIRESVRWGNLAHRLLQRYTRVGVTETEVSQRASDEATFAMLDAIGEIYRRAERVLQRRARRIPRTDRSQLGDPARARREPRVPGRRRPRHRRERARLGLPLGARADDVRRRADARAGADVRAHGRAPGLAFAAIRPGAACSDVDKAVRAYYDAHDLWPHWRHHTGHAIGLRYHEGPFLDSGDHTEIRPGMVFTVEPGLYSPELGGFRHSDTVLVTEDGIEILTYYPRDLASLVIPA